MWDYLVGEVPNPSTRLSLVVAASSAFPPFLSPLRLRLKESDYAPGSGGGLQQPDFMTDVFLSDGGVYDNLGLETAWKNFQTVLISDGGGSFKTEATGHANWVLQARRVLSVVDHQVRSLRKRQAIDSFKAGLRGGAYWGIGTNIDDYQLGDALPCPLAKTALLAAVPTRLSKVDRNTHERLINWGYAVSDEALRKYLDGSHSPPRAFPYPRATVG
jgi:NTE family protein